MSLDNRNTSAQFKRAEQLKRWEESDMAKQASGIPKSPSLRRIQFTPGCIFLAACDAGDKDEVEYLLQDGADIDTANVDGLTALHQACIDDNLDMVEFLVQKGADVNRKDNEGWTPLHATASCGFLSIARYLIENGADLAAINSDGELPVDLANSDAMEDLIQHHNEQQGIDCDEARQAEERIMLSDATKWLRTDSSDCDRPDPKTGATAMHVAAAKGYNRVLKLLLEGRGDIDRQDVDGWTPLHAAVYWGQKEATQMLLDAGADIDIQNYSGQLASDNAPKDILVLLDKARKNQARRTKRRPPSLGNRITDGFENSTETPTKVIRVEMKPIDNNKEKEVVSEKENQPTEPDVILRRTQSFENDEKKTTSNLVLGSTATTAATTPASAVAPTTVTTANTTTTVPSAGNAVGQTAVSNTSATVSPPTSPSGTPTTTPTAGQIRRSFVPPTRDEESETQRKAHAKRVRETRRSTQGVTLDEIKSAEQLVKKKNNPTGTESETTATGVNVTNVSTTNTTTISSSTSSPSSLSCYTSSPSSLSSSMTSTAFTTTASINDRVPAVKNATNNNNDNSNTGEGKITCGDELKNGDETPVVVSASFTLPAPSAVTSSIEQGEDDEGGGGGGDGGGRRHRRSLRESDNDMERKNDNEESGEKEDVTVSYTISAPALRSSSSSAPLLPPSSASSRTRLNSREGNEASDQRGETATPSVTATFHVSPPTTTATTKPISATGSSSPTAVSSGASNAEHSSAGSISASATIRTTVGNGPGGAVSNSNSSNITNTSTTTNNTNVITTAGGGGPITTTSSSTYTKRSLFDIDNANSLTLAEKLRHEANKYAIAADADSELGPLGEDSTASSRAVLPTTVTNTNEANPADSDSNSGSNAANAPADNSASVAAAPLSPSLRKDAATVSGSAAERRPSWRLKVDGGSKFKLEDASTPNVSASTTQSAIGGSTHESTTATTGVGAEHGSITTKLTSTSALAQRRLQQQQQQQNGDNTTSSARSASAGVGSSSSTVPSLAAAGEQYNRVPGTTAASTEPVSTDASLLNLRRPPRSTTASGGSVAGEENKENDKENDSRTAQATQAVIQRRRRQKRRSTGVVPVGMEDLDPDRQDSPVDGEEKETGSERGRSRVGSTASELDTASQQEGSRENGGDFIDYKALYEQEKAEKEKLKASLRKKDEEVVTLKAALDRFTTATTKNNSLSELEKRERRAMERKMSEMEEELKQLEALKTENQRLKDENGALIRVISKLSR
uniref:Protein phosphatase 1 regulatory subunit 12a isoform x6 n=1 Tax=Anopheles marajoara TaxID=58244 RepID=A0A2M4BA57_9DIPT